MRILKLHELIPFIKNYLPDNPVIVEAGSFNGRDTQRLAQCWPLGIVHAFEPVPEIFKQLEENTKNLLNVDRHRVALSSTTGTAEFNISENPHRPGTTYPAGSLLKPKERLKFSPAHYTKTIQVPTITLDDWAQKNNIQHVDFLWLDMQGNELAVLQAAPVILQQIKVIFTEVSFVEAYEGCPLYIEVQTWLEDQGFVAVAKDFENTDKWFFGNMIFTRAS